jgi:putative SOS response-associated peptidase YedK
MCGRFGLEHPEWSETRFQARQLDLDIHRLLTPRFNIAPTQPVIAVARSSRLDGALALKAMRWGLVSEWAKDDASKPRPFNLQSETLLDRAPYRRLLERKRCLIVADGFYEWDKSASRKQPWSFELPDRQVFGFAGLWDAVRQPDGWLVSCAVLTTSPNPLVGRFHDRMPVILSREAERVWLDEGASPVALRECLVSYPAEAMQAYPVVSLVNDVRNDGPQLRTPAMPPPQQGALPLAV